MGEAAEDAATIEKLELNEYNMYKKKLSKHTNSLELQILLPQKLNKTRFHRFMCSLGLNLHRLAWGKTQKTPKKKKTKDTFFLSSARTLRAINVLSVVPLRGKIANQEYDNIPFHSTCGLPEFLWHLSRPIPAMCSRRSMCVQRYKFPSLHGSTCGGRSWAGAAAARACSHLLGGRGRLFDAN